MVRPATNSLMRYGAVAERRLERGCADVALLPGGVGAFPPMLGQHVELTQDQRHFAVARRVENEGDLALAGLLDLDDVPVVGARMRVVLLEHLEREDHVLDRHRLAVVVARAGAQSEGRRGKIGRMTYRFCDQAVLGRTSSSADTSKVSEIDSGAHGDRALNAGHHHR